MLRFIAKLLFIVFISLVLDVFIHELVHCVQFNVPITNIELVLNESAVAWVKVEGKEAMRYNSNPDYYENEANLYSIFFMSIIVVIITIILFRR